MHPHIGFEYTVRHRRGGRVLSCERVLNLVPTEGLNYMLSAAFAGGTVITSWFIGIFTANYTPVATDTMATFPAAGVEGSAYTSATRPAWVEAPPVAGAVTNAASVAVFVFNASVAAVYGAFLASNSAKLATTGVLGSVAKFATPKLDLISGDDIEVTIPVTLVSTV